MIYDKEKYFSNQIHLMASSALLTALFWVIGWPGGALTFGMAIASTVVQTVLEPIIRRFCSREKAIILEQTLTLTLSLLTLAPLYLLGFKFWFVFSVVGCIVMGVSLLALLFSKSHRDKEIIRLYGKETPQTATPDLSAGRQPQPAPAPTINAAANDENEIPEPREFLNPREELLSKNNEEDSEIRDEPRNRRFSVPN